MSACGLIEFPSQIRFGLEEMEPTRKTRLRRATPSFLSKLYEILDASTYSFIIKWNEDGKSFTILNTKAFEETILEQYFKRANLTSFMRQINIYGFLKTKLNILAIKFEHVMFVRGAKHLLIHMKRRVTKPATGNQKESIKDIEESLMVRPIEDTTNMKLEENSSSSIKEEIDGQEVERILIDQIKELRVTQGILSKKFEIMEKQAEVYDMSVQMDMNLVYQRDVDRNISYFLMFTLEKFMQQGNNTHFSPYDKLSNMERNSINAIGNMFKYPGSNLFEIFHRLANSLKIPLKIPHTCSEIAQYENNAASHYEFLKWVREFLFFNEIDFPYAEQLFNKLLTSISSADWMTNIRNYDEEDPKFLDNMNNIGRLTKSMMTKVYKDLKEQEKIEIKEEMRRKGFLCQRVTEKSCNVTIPKMPPENVLINCDEKVIEDVIESMNIQHKNSSNSNSQEIESVDTGLTNEKYSENNTYMGIGDSDLLEEDIKIPLIDSLDDPWEMQGLDHIFDPEVFDNINGFFTKA